MDAEGSKANRPLLMGHRGTGACSEQKSYRDECIASNAPVPETIRENTVKAMKVTHASGGNYVEFDVQLSKDKVAVVHHDFYTEDGRFVGDLTAKELWEVNEKSSCHHEEYQYPMLKSFFTELPEELGFDIEIKYPRYYLSGESVCPEFAWDQREYVEAIVDTVKQFSGSSKRPIFYSCFVSEVCLLLQRLHPECPVVFIGASSNARELTETHGYSADSCLQFAASAGLHGVAVNSHELLQDCEFGREFVQRCRRSGLRCVTWGVDNNKSEARSLQSDWGVHGLIFDSIHARGREPL